ncbi:5-methyltetrahydropteroyltriglutamate-homocysteine methyltransferase [Apiospora aurea]|uniref:5-methyltetrahydropteroyltriglutamate-homocysteine methyltransferase n=1 Tax=Apiospora aurea TaxID=335848 RepID=A0ABR1Q2R5_9PEZI
MPPPFRADHVGSLLRPQGLLDARAELASPSKMYSLEVPEAVKEAESQAIRDVVQLQLNKGIRPITDGEYARHIYYGGFFEKLSGFEARPDLRIPDAFRTDFPTTTGLARMGAKTRAAVVCTGRIGYKESPYLAEWLALRDSLPEQHLWKEAKMTIPTPNYQHIQLKPGTAWTPKSGYASDPEYLDDLAKCYAAELQTLYKHGLRNIQIDDPHLTYFCSPQFVQGCTKDGTDTDALLDLYIRTHNRLLRDLPKDLHVGVHLCRGNMAGSTHWVAGSYEKIAYKLFRETDYGTYLMEAELEDRGTVTAALREAAAVVAAAQEVGVEEALDSLALSPQCGFSSSSLAGGVGMTRERMWEKLGLVRSIAEEVWPGRS